MFELEKREADKKAPKDNSCILFIWVSKAMET